MNQPPARHPIKIPVYQPELTGNERRYVNECLESTWISSRGHFVERFEREFAAYCGVSHAATVVNGTAALHLALLGLGIRPGDEVLVPSSTYVATANAVMYVGATPIFVDSDPETWQICPKDVERKLTPRTRAVIVVHLYGHPCEMESIMQVARSRRLFVVEDCAEAVGTLYKGKHVGTFGDVATFSFFGNKTLTTGEGGMVASEDSTLMERMRHFKGQGLAKYREYWHDVVGYNYRMTNICAAIGVAQLEDVESRVVRKRLLADKYRRGLAGLPVLVHGEYGEVRHSYWMVSILVDDESARDPLREHLASGGIETRPVFPPIHTMPMFSGRYERLAVAESLARRGINLPSWPGLDDSQVAYVCERVTEFFEPRRNR